MVIILINELINCLQLAAACHTQLSMTKRREMSGYIVQYLASSSEKMLRCDKIVFVASR